MNEQEQQIAIAEFCGWNQCRYNGAYDTLEGVPPLKPSIFQDIPDYLNDLNDIHEAVSKLSPLDKRIFGDVLNEILEVFDDDYYEGMIPSHKVSCFSEAITRISQANAKQKSEALLRTLGLWKD